MKNLLRAHSWTLALVALLTVMLSPSTGTADEVILDDLIVDGSACVGLDCGNDLFFGFSTLILKETNLRIYFDDTSSTEQFPPNDWEIIANDANNGGLSFLGFADRGAGLASVSGQGTCEGGLNDGNACGTGVLGEDCSGACVGGSFPGNPCLNDTFCPGGGTCQGVGMCVAPGAVIFRIHAGGPEDSLVIDSAGDVNIAGNLTVGGTINGGSSSEIQELQEEVATLQAQIQAILSFPAIQQFLNR